VGLLTAWGTFGFQVLDCNALIPCHNAIMKELRSIITIFVHFMLMILHHLCFIISSVMMQQGNSNKTNYFHCYCYSLWSYTSPDCSWKNRWLYLVAAYHWIVVGNFCNALSHPQLIPVTGLMVVRPFRISAVASETHNKCNSMNKYRGEFLWHGMPYSILNDK